MQVNDCCSEGVAAKRSVRLPSNDRMSYNQFRSMMAALALLPMLALDLP